MKGEPLFTALALKGAAFGISLMGKKSVARSTGNRWEGPERGLTPP